MPILTCVIRHLLTVAAGALMTVGVSEYDANNLVNAVEIVSGVILYSVGQSWSIFDKKKR